MTATNKWQRALMRLNARKHMRKLYKGHLKELEEIKDKIADVIESTDESNQLHILVIICAEIIAGLESKQERQFVIDLTAETLKYVD